MGLKVTIVFLLIALSAVLLQNVFAKPNPRDSTIVEEHRIVAIDNGGLIPKEYTTTKPDSSEQEVKIPGRISCEYDEATEDVVCQEHCLPKGYTYGICVSHTCSCI